MNDNPPTSLPTSRDDLCAALAHHRKRCTQNIRFSKRHRALFEHVLDAYLWHGIIDVDAYKAGKNLRGSLAAQSLKHPFMRLGQGEAVIMRCQRFLRCTVIAWSERLLMLSRRPCMTFFFACAWTITALVRQERFELFAKRSTYLSTIGGVDSS